MYTFKVKESESKGKISKFQHFIRQTCLFAVKGYFSCGIGLVFLVPTILPVSVSFSSVEQHTPPPATFVITDILLPSVKSTVSPGSH